MSHLFVDTNVLLDFIMRRAPFAIAAAELFQLAENRSIWLYCIACLSAKRITSCAK